MLFTSHHRLLTPQTRPFFEQLQTKRNFTITFVKMGLSYSKEQKSSKRDTLMTRDGPNCQICGKVFSQRNMPTFDHIIPKAQGGLGCNSNLRLTCLACNQFRGREGDMAARAKVLQTKEATAATDKAISRAAAQSDQQAPNPKTRHPNGKVGQTTSMSRATPKQRSQQRNSNRNGVPSGGNGTQRGNGGADGKKRKQQAVTFASQNRPAKNQGNENGDPPKKQRQRPNPQSTQTRRSEKPASSANNAPTKNRQQRKEDKNQGGANNARQRNV
jgi:5-methylcytosine-specific restriction endonuclease McrA